MDKPHFSLSWYAVFELAMLSMANLTRSANQAVVHALVWGTRYTTREVSYTKSSTYIHICISRCFVLATLLNLDTPMRELCCSMSGSLLNTIHYN